MSTQETVDAIKADLARFKIPKTDEDFDAWVEKAVADRVITIELPEGLMKQHAVDRPCDLPPEPMAQLWGFICKRMMVGES